eukprot:1296080-Rhodomonas_salina.2
MNCEGLRVRLSTSCRAGSFLRVDTEKNVLVPGTTQSIATAFSARLFYGLVLEREFYTTIAALRVTVARKNTSTSPFRFKNMIFIPGVNTGYSTPGTDKGRSVTRNVPASNDALCARR